MHFTSLAVAMAATLVRLTLAAPGRVEHSPSATHSTTCVTTWGKSSTLYSTRWTTSYASCTSTRTSTKTITTNKPSTTTTTVSTTTVTVTGSSKTATTTTTSTTTDTTTVTDSTSTVSTTTSTSTSTVPTSAGFQPVQTTLPDSSYSGSGGSDPVSKRDAVEDRAIKVVVEVSRHRYVNGVQCTVERNGRCVHTSTTVTSTVSASSTTTVSVTATVTSTTYPSATSTTTKTVTTSTTVPTTTTTTTTTVSTSTTSTTVYAACATNNLADEVSGEDIYQYYSSDDNEGPTTVTLSTDNAYDCCVSAILAGDAQIFAYQGGTCTYYEQPSCNSQSESTWTAEGTSSPPSSGGIITVGNAACGEFTAALT